MTFDRVYILNLRRRPDRLRLILRELDTKGWPFAAQPFVLNAIDGEKVQAPEGYTLGNNAWACFQSHRHAIELAINEGAKSVLILEDDAIFCEGFYQKAVRFMGDIPGDWEFAFLGGNHHPLPPIAVSPGIVKPQRMDRMHAYAARGKGLIDLYRYWHQWHTGHCDQAISTWITERKTYCAQPWLIGQREGASDVNRQPDGSGTVSLCQWFQTPEDKVIPAPSPIEKANVAIEWNGPILSGIMPTRGRSEQAANSIKSFYATTDGHQREFICVSHPEEGAKLLMEMAEDQGAFPGLKVITHDADPITCWNEGLKHARGFLLSISDDDLIYTGGWFDALLRKWEEVGRPDAGCFGLYDPDDRVMNGELFTRTVVTRPFAMTVLGGVLCVPLFKRWFNDNSTTVLARKANCAYPCFESIIHHNQAQMGLSPWDATAELGKQRGVHDEQTYRDWLERGANIEWEPVVK